MVAAGGVDDAIGRFRLRDQQRSIVQAADHGFNSQCLEFVRLFRATDKAADLMAVANQTRRNRTTDKTACASYENLHVCSPIKPCRPELALQRFTPVPLSRCMQYPRLRFSQKQC